jgi:hypothetical protein
MKILLDYTAPGRRLTMYVIFDDAIQIQSWEDGRLVGIVTMPQDTAFEEAIAAYNEGRPNED